jgi:hypothetical protein
MEFFALFVLYLIWASFRSRRQSEPARRLKESGPVQTEVPNGRAMMELYALDYNIQLSAWSEKTLEAVADIYGVYFALSPNTRSETLELAKRLEVSRKILESDFDSETVANLAVDGDSRRAERLRTAAHRLGHPYSELFQEKTSSQVDYFEVAEEFIDAWERFPHPPVHAW